MQKIDSRNFLQRRSSRTLGNSTLNSSWHIRMSVVLNNFMNGLLVTKSCEFCWFFCIGAESLNRTCSTVVHKFLQTPTVAYTLLHICASQLKLFPECRVGENEKKTNEWNGLPLNISCFFHYWHLQTPSENSPFHVDNQTICQWPADRPAPPIQFHCSHVRVYKCLMILWI